MGRMITMIGGYYVTPELVTKLNERLDATTPIFTTRSFRHSNDIKKLFLNMTNVYPSDSNYDRQFNTIYKNKILLDSSLTENGSKSAMTDLGIDLYGSLVAVTEKLIPKKGSGFDSYNSNGFIWSFAAVMSEYDRDNRNTKLIPSSITGQNSGHYFEFNNTNGKPEFLLSTMFYADMGLSHGLDVYFLYDETLKNTLEIYGSALGTGLGYPKNLNTGDIVTKKLNIENTDEIDNYGNKLMKVRFVYSNTSYGVSQYHGRILRIWIDPDSQSANNHKPIYLARVKNYTKSTLAEIN